jgi:hypothetical protein
VILAIFMTAVYSNENKKYNLLETSLNVVNIYCNYMTDFSHLHFALNINKQYK